jgi:hypothetical protein
MGDNRRDKAQASQDGLPEVFLRRSHDHISLARASGEALAK